MKEHPHGDINRYRHGGCRCTPCRAANTREVNLYRAAVLTGRQRPKVNAEPIRQHVQRLRGAGLGISRIAQLANVAPKVIGNLLYGHPSVNRAPSAKLLPGTADRLLAVHVGQLPPAGWVPGVGTQRRLQALAAMGWPTRTIERRLDRPRGYFQRIIIAPPGIRVVASLARALADLYDELWNVDPATAGVSAGAIARLRGLALRKGWPPPVAWDDIDNPDETPRGLPCPELPPEDLFAALEERRGQLGLTWDDVAADLGFSREPIKALRAGRVSPTFRARVETWLAEAS